MESERPWLTSVASDICKAYCKVCSQEIQTKQNGKEKIKQHEKSSKYIEAVRGTGVQTTHVGNVKLCQSILHESLIACC